MFSTGNQNQKYIEENRKLPLEMTEEKSKWQRQCSPIVQAWNTWSQVPGGGQFYACPHLFSLENAAFMVPKKNFKCSFQGFQIKPARFNWHRTSNMMGYHHVAGLVWCSWRHSHTFLAPHAPIFLKHNATNQIKNILNKGIFSWNGKMYVKCE